MTKRTLILHTLIYHWRTNLAVLLGVLAGTAVVGGALIVGDSVRGSLREMTLVRLGRIDYALHGPRFFREALTEELKALPAFGERFDAAAPAIVLPASLEKPAAGSGKVAARAGGVTLYAVDERLWELTRHGEARPPQGQEVVLSHRLATQLEAKPGETVNLLVELPSAIPRDSLLGERDETARQLPFTVAAVLDEASGVGRLGLRPDQQLPLNAFVSLKTLQDRLGLASREPTRRNPRAAEARVNAIFVSAKGAAEQSLGDAAAASEELTRLVAKVWRLADFNLRIERNTARNTLSLESDRMILDKTVAAGAEKVARELHASSSPVLIYLANELTADKGKLAHSMYSVVAGLDPELFSPPAVPPFGPYEFVDAAPTPPLGEGDILKGGTGEIILNDWLAQDLKAQAGDVVRIKYHLIGSRGELPEEERRFTVRAIVKLRGTVAADLGLTPNVPGITDAKTLSDWEQPFPMKLDQVTSRDEAYWNEYRATPKAFVTLKTARHLWQSRYGDLTSFRVAALPGKTLDASAQKFETALLQVLQPPDVGLVFQPVKQQGLRASSGATDFGGLFLGFSCFLILSAMILIGLLFRLGIERRAAGVGLLLATGFPLRDVRRLLLAEGLLVVMAGGGLGILAAVGYAALMIHGLKTWWIGAIGTRFLDLYVKPASLLLGLSIAVAVALAAIWWGLRELRSISVRGLLAGATQRTMTAESQRRRGRMAFLLALGGTACAAALSVAVVTGLVPNREAFSGFSMPTITFFVVGMAVLVAGLAFLSVWLESNRSAAVRGAGFRGVARLGMRNAARHRSRSVLTAGLIASATFLIVAISAAHRNPATETPVKDSGNGGFTLVADSAIPVLNDLNTSDGRKKLDLADSEAAKVLQAVTDVVPFRVNPGENASCLNIYQTSQPVILGVPPEMIARGGFKFVGASQANPWTLLGQEIPDGAIPVFGDMNTLMYSLHVGPGATLELRDEENHPVKVQVAGMLDSSVFQGVLLMAESHFKKLFPSRAGYQYFLIEVPPESATSVSELLESKLPGFDAERVAERLASFLAVQNTYLSTFQTLGGLGLLLGTIGLGTVMLRNVIERRSELALLRAVGFRNSSLAWLVLCENALLLAWGLVAGTASALLAMLPHMLSTGADVPWSETTLILSAVFAVGMGAALFAVRAALNTPVLATLRAE